MSTSNIANTPVPSHLYELFVPSIAGTTDDPSIIGLYLEFVSRHAAEPQFSSSM